MKKSDNEECLHIAGRPQLGIVRRRTSNTYVFYTKIKNIYRKVNLRGVVKTSKGHTCEMVYDYL